FAQLQTIARLAAEEALLEGGQLQLEAGTRQLFGKLLVGLGDLLVEHCFQLVTGVPGASRGSRACGEQDGNGNPCLFHALFSLCQCGWGCRRGGVAAPLSSARPRWCCARWAALPRPPSR